MHSVLFAIAAALLAKVTASEDVHVLNRDSHRNLAKLVARSTKSNSLPTGWALQAACLTDANKPNRLLETSSNWPTTLTPASCITACKSDGFSIAAVQYGIECWCGNSLSNSTTAGQKADASLCDYPCSGDSTQTCGGYFHLSLYGQSNSSSPPSSPSSSPSSTKTNAPVTTTKSSSSSPAPSSTPSIPASKLKLVENMAGSDFFNHFNFFNSPDPTNGQVTYVSAKTANTSGLAYVDNGAAVIRVDNKNTLAAGAKRNSVRIQSKKQFGKGLLVFDVAHMPFGCSIWPALWMVGPNWPQGGEIDIIEGVNDNTKNQLTLHTGSSTTCNTNAVSQSKIGPNINFMARTCASKDGANSGCGFQDQDPKSYGQGFNDAGGAVYALSIASSAITIWRFERGSIPADLTAGKPNPDSWTQTPSATWPSQDGCLMTDVIKAQTIVLDITLCGGWASDAYSQGSCSGTCSQQVMDPKNYDDALFKMNSIKIYQ